MDTFDIPILLIVFSRVDTTEQVVERLRSIQPKKLYIAADGARTHKLGEDKKVKAVRDYLKDAIDWECEVHTKYAEKNLGCKYNPQDAITWFFEHEEKGIILEDDCVASNSFFKYCKELLSLYEDDLRIFGITGTSVIKQAENHPHSYYFSEYVQTWGWATWSDRWRIHLEALKNFETHLDDPLVQDRLDNKEANRQIIHQARISYLDQLDAWDFQWFFTAFANHGLFAVPKVNLIHNVGDGEDATHTRGGKMHREKEIDLPLSHPVNILPHKEWDSIFYKYHYGWMSTAEKLKNPQYIKAFLRSKFK